MSNSPRNFSVVRFTERHGSASSTEGGRGRTTAYGRECHDLLNKHFFTLKGRKGMRGRFDTFASLFFTFKFTNSSNTGALARAGV